MAHRRARLTPLGRQLLVSRVLEYGWPAARAAEASGVSRATVYKWLRRHREGRGLEDASSRAKRCPHRLSEVVEQAVLAARRELKQGPHRLGAALGMPRSTVYAVLLRNGSSRLRDFDRLTSIPIRYVRERPGELVHVDVKKLGRVPIGGGHRLLGRAKGKRHSRKVDHNGYDFLHVAVDDHSRLAYVEVLADERDRTTADFLLRAAAFFDTNGIRVERVLSDQGSAYRSRAFALASSQLGIQLRKTKPYRPQTNGKAERFIRTLVEEWAYARFYPTNDARLADLPAWLDFYNQRRPHTALRGQSPAAVVNNGDGNYN